MVNACPKWHAATKGPCKEIIRGFENTHIRWQHSTIIDFSINEDVDLILFFILFFYHYAPVSQTDALWLLQLVISSPLIDALGGLSQAPTGIRTQVPSLRGGRLTNWAIPAPHLNNTNIPSMYFYVLLLGKEVVPLFLLCNPLLFPYMYLSHIIHASTQLHHFYTLCFLLIL